MSMTLITADYQRGRFLVDKRAFVDQGVFEKERDTVFSRCWLYVGHESEIAEPGQFVSRQVGNDQILFARDKNGKVHAFDNLCTHRGVVLSVEKCGKAKSFTCPYHGWTFSNTGALLDQAARYGYSEQFNSDGFYNLHEVPRLEHYRGFWFMNLNPRAIDLRDYLAGAKEWIDLVVDQADQGLEVTPGEQEFRTGCNWKSISENQIDSYHGLSLHPSYFEYAQGRAGESATAQASAYIGSSNALGNGHAGFEIGVRVGKPSADWIPAFGEAVRPLIEKKRADLIAKFGEERAMRMAARTRNLLIFPNTILNDVVSLSIRTSFPEGPETTRSNIWSLAHKGEDPLVRKIRLENHRTFVGPGGFAHPDDYEMFDLRAIGDRQSRNFLHDYSKGMVPEEGKDPLHVTGDHLNEAQHRAWWTQWNRVVSGAETFEI